MRPRVFRLLSNRRFQGTITFILHYPDLGTTARKIGTAKSANSAKRSRRRLAIKSKSSFADYDGRNGTEGMGPWARLAAFRVVSQVVTSEFVR